MRRLDWREIVVLSGTALSSAALAALTLGPIGWRAGWWHWSLSLGILTPLAACLGAAGALASLAGIVRLRGDRKALAIAVVSLAAGGAAVYAPSRLYFLAAAYPPINDISTDLTNPPPFSAALPLRATEFAVSADYPGAETARWQRAAYPGVAPVETSLPAADAFRLALSAAEGMSGWRLVASSEADGRIEASQSSFWYGFVDDIAIRVASQGQGSRIDVRSHSRQGRGDLGVNARRVCAYIEALAARIRAAQPDGVLRRGQC